MPQTKEEWAEEHGYWCWICRDCGMSGWTDSQPECACELEKIDESPESK